MKNRSPGQSRAGPEATRLLADHVLAGHLLASRLPVDPLQACYLPADRPLVALLANAAASSPDIWRRWVARGSSVL